MNKTTAHAPRNATIPLRDCRKLLEDRERTHRTNVRTREEFHKAELAREVARAEAAARTEENAKREARDRRQVIGLRIAQLAIGALLVLVGRLLGLEVPWPT